MHQDDSILLGKSSRTFNLDTTKLDMHGTALKGQGFAGKKALLSF